MFLAYHSLISEQAVLMADMVTTAVKYATSFVGTKHVNKQKAFVYMAVWKDTPERDAIKVGGLELYFRLFSLFLFPFAHTWVLD